MVAENQSENLRWRTFDRQPGKCCSKRQEDQKQFSQVNQIPPRTSARKVLARFSIRMSEREPEPPGPDGGWGWLVCLAAFYCVSVLDGSASQYLSFNSMSTYSVLIMIYPKSVSHIHTLQEQHTHLGSFLILWRWRWEVDTARWESRI